jgi:hypothetical protein
LVTLKEIEMVLNTTRRTGARVVVRLRNSRYHIAMDREIRAVDNEGRSVPWSSAFPTTPQQAIDAYGIREIEIHCGNTKKTLHTWRELLNELEDLC